MDLNAEQQKRKHILAGVIVCGVFTAYRILSAGTSWEGEWMTNNLGEILAAMLGGGIIGLLVYKARFRSK